MRAEPGVVIMRLASKALSVGILCLASAVGAVLFLSDAVVSNPVDRFANGGKRLRETARAGSAEQIRAPFAAGAMPLFSDEGFENAGFGTACRYTGDIGDRSSLDEVREAVRGRARRGIVQRHALLDSLREDTADTRMRAFRCRIAPAFLYMSEGAFHDAAKRVAPARASDAPLPKEDRANLDAPLATIHPRKGETENRIQCIGPSSCIFPLDDRAIHLKRAGSEAAVRHDLAYLKQRPEDLGVRRRLNPAYMTLGEYPGMVPPEYLTPLAPFRSKTRDTDGNGSSRGSSAPARTAPRSARSSRRKSSGRMAPGARSIAAWAATRATEAAASSGRSAPAARRRSRN